MGVGSNSQKRKAAYDPQRKWGLAPASEAAAPSSEADGATYIVSGHVVASGKRDLFLSESVGREAQARAARQATSRDTDAALKRLLARDKEGMKAVQEARRFAKNAQEKQNAAPGKDKLSRAKKRKAQEQEQEQDRASNGGNGIDDSDECADESDDASAHKSMSKNAYSARVIKNLGFDPTALRSSRGQKDDDPGNIYSKVCHFIYTALLVTIS
jgi:minichromosome maintenance protein 10